MSKVKSRKISKDSLGETKAFKVESFVDINENSKFVKGFLRRNYSGNEVKKEDKRKEN